MADHIIPLDHNDEINRLMRILDEKPVSIGRAPIPVRHQDMQVAINQDPQTPREREERVDKMRRHDITVPVDDFMHSPRIETEAMSEIEAANFVNELKDS